VTEGGNERVGGITSPHTVADKKIAAIKITGEIEREGSRGNSLEITNGGLKIRSEGVERQDRRVWFGTTKIIISPTRDRCLRHSQMSKTKPS